jgi:AmiR/NasT family two-component response regulator
MQQRQTSNKPFQNSLSALAQVAMRETASDGYAFFRRTPGTRTFVREDASGSVIAEDALNKTLSPGSSNSLVVTYPMGNEWLLAFAFHDHARLQKARPQLDRIAATIEAVWRTADAVERYSQLAHQVADLEACLMDSKIADRARGFLQDREASTPVETIVRHVEGVLRESSTRRILEQISRELAEEVEERRLVGRAKAILQRSEEMSEEAAHAHLRLVSRKSRRRLKDVALEVIQRHPVEEPVHD